MMFRPPAATVTPVSWLQVFGFRQDSDALWGQVRATQLTILRRHLPFNLSVMIVNLAAIGYRLRGIGDMNFMVMLSAMLAVVLAAVLYRSRRRPRAAADAGVGPLELWTVTAEVVAIGLCWGLLILHLLPRATLDQQMLLLLLSLTAVGASSFANAILPVAGVAIVVSINFAVLVGLPRGSPLATWPVLLAFVTFALLMIRGMMVTTLAMIVRLQTQGAVRDQSEVIALLLSEFETNGSDWLLEVDQAGILTHVSPRFAQVAGLPRETMVGMPLLSLLGKHGDGDGDAALQRLTDLFIARQPFRDVIVPVPAPSGERRWWQLSGTPKLDAAGRFTGYRGVGSDVTEMRNSKDRLTQLARYDPLTGLVNRSFLRDRVATALRIANGSTRGCALLFVDLDRFKQVNDSLGHYAGDQLLREVAQRLREALGESATIGRLGGDEFAVLLQDVSADEADVVAGALIVALAEPFQFDQHKVVVGASIGYACGPADGATVDRLLRSADLALYEVKRTGRGRACRFVPAIQERADERRALEHDLRGALANHELVLAFQPVMDVSDERLVGFEALLRWHHPTRGVIPPLKFIPIAEETRLIVPIGAWVIEEACRWARRWPTNLQVAVNLSPAQFDDRRLPAIVRAALTDNGIAPERLELEITESLFLNEQPSTMALLTEMKAIGVTFALDDFGTGYSSLGYLHKAAFSRIKIDRSFVQRATAHGGEAVAIIQAIVALAASLGMTTTAEGAETRAEFEAIRSLGCSQVQGYLFGRPMTAEAATELALAPVPQARLALVS